MVSRINRLTLKAWFAAPMLMVGLLAGCSAPTADLKVRSSAQQREYVQTFPRAYASETRDGAGEFDAVLFVDSSDRLGGGSPHGPLASNESAGPMQQVLHVRVMWQPLRGSHTDLPTATNASLTWIVREAPADPSAMPNALDTGGPGLVYQGAGFVIVHPDEKGIEFSIRNATLSLKESRGGLADPLGRASVRGDFYAWRNASKVQSSLESLSRSATSQP